MSDSIKPYMIPTRTTSECEQLVALWTAGERDQVLAAFGGAEPSEHFLETFKSTSAQPRRSKPPKRQMARQKKKRRADDK